MPFWPREIEMTAIDLTPGMLEHAQQRAVDLKLRADLRLGDVQALNFPDSSFDTAVATFVFCSVPDPVLGLHELKRVVKPGGQVILLEHMRSPQAAIGKIMDVFNPVVVRVMGANTPHLRWVQVSIGAPWRMFRQPVGRSRKQRI